MAFDPNISTAESGASAPRLPDKGQRLCAECGKPYTARREASRFCCPQCRTDFLNRRNMRGAIAYDLFMALRFERDDARRKQVWSAMCRLAADWRNEDNAKREGRVSWGDWREYLIERPYLFADRLIKNWAGRQGVKRKPKAKP